MCLIRQILNAWVRSPGSSFGDKAFSTGDLPDNLNAAAQWGSKFD
jgi:hypothetical protein